jgi:AcrR family transcriptional regulator
MTRSVRSNRGPGAAAENRQALLDAAHVVFSDAGIDVPFNAIARAAGVGQGVLYRHFPDRIDLAMAVFEENMAALEEMGSDPERTLFDLLDLVTDQAIASVAFVDMVTASVDDERLARMADRLATALSAKLESAQNAALVHENVTSEDLALAVGMIASLMARLPAADRRESADRAWALLQTGLSPRWQTPRSRPGG